MILSTLLFLAGIHFTMQLLAAGYRLIDLWYRIEDFWPGVLARILLLSAVEGLLIALLPQQLLIAFLWGQICYLGFHIVVFWLLRLAIFLMESRRL